MLADKGLARCIVGAVSVLALCTAAVAVEQSPASNGSAVAERRVALVIGNSAYPFGSLKNPVNDARSVTAALRDLGFIVTLKQDATLETMLDTLRRFLSESRSSDVRLVYYAGHGVQVKGKNYLIPVDAEITSEAEISAKSADLTMFLDRLGEFANGVNIVILDACRDNPFAHRTRLDPGELLFKPRQLAGESNHERVGLARVAAPRGTLIAFSTAPGAVAADSVNAKNSVYTKHLLANMSVAGVQVEQLFKRVRIAVAEETKHHQIPWESSSLMGDFCFKIPSDGACGSSDR
jgi:uncharacterized caspase-like protein